MNSVNKSFCKVWDMSMNLVSKVIVNSAIGLFQ